jgi:ComF family protein
MLNFVLNFLFPPTCILCEKQAPNYICEKCNKRFEKYAEFNIIDNQKLIMDKLNIKNVNFRQKFYLVDNQKIYWEKLLYCFDYKNLIRKYLLQFKFNNRPYLANFFTYQILKSKKVNEILKNYDIIIPVPMDKKKQSKRGYNQTELITKIISKTGIIKEENILKKIKKTKTQSLLTPEERKQNIENAFCIKFKEKVKNKNIILFDDIYTTGATSNEISKILKEAGAKNILVLVIAKD